MDRRRASQSVNVQGFVTFKRSAIPDIFESLVCVCVCVCVCVIGSFEVPKLPRLDYMVVRVFYREEGARAERSND